MKVTHTENISHEDESSRSEYEPKAFYTTILQERNLRDLKNILVVFTKVKLRSKLARLNFITHRPYLHL